MSVCLNSEQDKKVKFSYQKVKDFHCFRNVNRYNNEKMSERDFIKKYPFDNGNDLPQRTQKTCIKIQ